MLNLTKKRELLKALGGESSRADYEEKLIQKYFFKHGAVYFKVFPNPTALRQAIDEAVREGLIGETPIGLLTVSPLGKKYLHPIYTLIQSSSLLALVIAVAAAGFAGGATINAWWESKNPVVPITVESLKPEPRYYAHYEIVGPPGTQTIYGTTTMDEKALWYATGQDKPQPKIDFEEAKRLYLVK